METALTPGQVEQQAWSAGELQGDPHQHESKATKVRSMFGAIAGSYDLNNRVHSFGRDQAWRRTAVKKAAPKPGERVLDCACGTGDLTRAFAASGVEEVVGLDFTPEMLEIARRKPMKSGAPVRYLDGDAMALPFEDSEFDIVSIAFGIRNVADPMKALREFRRVLRPGGRLVILEFGLPRSKVVRFFHDLYTCRIMPFTATLISRDRSGAYRYLPRSVNTFQDRSAMESSMAEAGFGDIEVTSMTTGVCLCYVGHLSE